MILSYATSLVAIAATAICFIIITLMYWRSPSGPLTFKRRVIIADYCLLLLYLCCHFFRSRNDETEILCVPSILSLYLLWESFLITCTTFSNVRKIQTSMPYYSITFCPCLFWLLRWYMRQMVISIISRTMTKWCRLLTKQYRWRHICELLLWLVSYSVCY